MLGKGLREGGRGQGWPGQEGVLKTVEGTGLSRNHRPLGR